MQRGLTAAMKAAGATAGDHFLTPEEVVLLLATCAEHFAEHHAFVLTLARTGMRIGEAVALQWGDVDFAGRFAELRRAWNDGQLTTPKSGKGRRVDLSQYLAKTLRAWLVRCEAKKLRRGWKELPSWVFPNENGNALNGDYFRKRVWPKLLAKARLRRIRILDLRHTYASLLIGQGESLAYVKSRWGTTASA